MRDEEDSKMSRLRFGPSPHRYSDCGEFVTIMMPRGTETTVDAADYPTAELYRWWSDKDGYAQAKVCDSVTKKQTTLRMHRLLLAPPADMHIDHIDCLLYTSPSPRD
mgnify:CR=1 FL=1